MPLPPHLADIKIVIPEGFDREPAPEFNLMRLEMERYQRFLQTKIVAVVLTEEERRKRERERAEKARIVELLDLPESLVRIAKEHTWQRWREAVAKQWELARLAGEVIDEAEVACGVG